MLKTITRRRSRLTAAALGAVAATSLALAPVASAAPGQTSSTGLACGGLVTCGPFAASAFPAGPATNSVASAAVGTLLTTGVINTTANAGGATASVADLNVRLSALRSLTATAVSSQCTVNSTSGAVSGSTSIVNGTVTVLTGTPITLATSPAPNSTVSVAGLATITLNRQTTAPDGTLTVDAIYVQLLNSTQTITVASSVCGPRVLPIPVVAPAVAVGGAAVAVVGLPALGMFLYRRRPTSTRQSRA